MVKRLKKTAANRAVTAAVMEVVVLARKIECTLATLVLQRFFERRDLAQRMFAIHNCNFQRGAR